MRKRATTAEGRDTSNPAASLTRGLEILRAFGPGDSTLGNLDLIERTGLPKATISRLTATLVQLGYLDYDAQLGRYQIGAATVALGYAALSSSPLVQVGKPWLQGLADRTHVSVALGARDGLDMVYLATCRAHGPVTLRLNVGSLVPMWRTAMGLSYLAGTEAREREALTRQLTEREPDQAGRITDIIGAACDSYREHGFVTTFGTWYSYINAVGTVFRPTDGTPLVALTCGGIVDLLSREKSLDEVGPDLLRTVEAIRNTLNGVTNPVAQA